MKFRAPDSLHITVMLLGGSNVMLCNNDKCKEVYAAQAASRAEYKNSQQCSQTEGKDKLNRCDFKCVLKVVNVQDRHRSTGSLFQARTIQLPA